MKFAMYSPHDTWSVMPVVIKPSASCLQYALSPSSEITVRISIQP
ncbi:MAG: hypothetical protein ACYTGY_12335 [Planctomycetota bacterium]